MWERNAEVGGTPSLGPPQPFAPFTGSDGTLIQGMSHAYGALNYTCVGITKDDYITFRNEIWRDDTGFRSGFAGTYTSSTIGISHNFNKLFQVPRGGGGGGDPEIGVELSQLESKTALATTAAPAPAEGHVDVRFRFDDPLLSYCEPPA